MKLPRKPDHTTAPIEPKSWIDQARDYNGRYAFLIAILAVVIGALIATYYQARRVQHTEIHIEEAQLNAIRHAEDIQDAIQERINEQLREQGIDVPAQP
jgi:hypothetical protein